MTATDLSDDFARMASTLKVSVSPAYKQASIDMLLDRAPDQAPQIIEWLIGQAEANYGQAAFEQIQTITLKSCFGKYGTGKEVNSYCDMVNRTLRKDIERSAPALAVA